MFSKNKIQLIPIVHTKWAVKHFGCFRQLPDKPIEHENRTMKLNYIECQIGISLKLTGIQNYNSFLI